MEVARAAALSSVRREPRADTAATSTTDEIQWMRQPPTRATETPDAEPVRAWARANQARSLAAKEHLDERATPAAHPAAGKEHRERHWTAADHSRWRRLALAAPETPRFASAARLTSVRSVRPVSRPGALPPAAAGRRRPARAR
ncbi:hypothetical protein [Micromonospora sp. LOL_024]|uniref:hypothetical protein n=1 Tax=Micromonospora sp. LOL_024 TaxID=3345412 RepID=UPI003A856219